MGIICVNLKYLNSVNIVNFYFMLPSKSFIMLCSHQLINSRFVVKLKIWQLYINAIYQSICKYILVHTTHLWYIIIYFHTIKNITIGTVKQKKTKKKKLEKTSDTDCQCLLNILFWGYMVCITD